MRTLDASLITQSIETLCLRLGVELNPHVCSALESAEKTEENDTTRFALNIMTENACIAKITQSPVCQDTGMAVVFIRLGQDVRVVNGFIGDAVNEGVRRAFQKGSFRKSILGALNRINTQDNTPAVIHYEIVPGDRAEFSVLLKGFGSENMSCVFMLTPSDGIEGVENAVVTAVQRGGGNPCPPIVAGVGIGGTMEKAAIMSKHALLREIDSENPDKTLNDLEQRILKKLNALGIGAQGFGGKLTALGVFCEEFPTHLAGLPVAVTIQCHAVRHGGFQL